MISSWISSSPQSETIVPADVSLLPEWKEDEINELKLNYVLINLTNKVSDLEEKVNRLNKMIKRKPKSN
jgi:hypothetical protein